MASHPKGSKKRSPFTKDRGIPGAFEGETVTRRRFMELNALAVGGVASAAFGLPTLGFALAPMFEDSTSAKFQDVGPEADFNPETYISKVISIQDDVGEAGKTTIYVRKYNPKIDSDKFGQPYVVLSNRCMHVGCPVRYVQASQRFICPCHGGVYSFDGTVSGGPPVRPLDRFESQVQGGRVMIGSRFSVNSQLNKTFSPRDPSNILDGPGQYLYPSRPSARKSEGLK